MVDVAIIVLNYNSSDETAASIPDLVSQEGIKKEIIIVDNNSTQNGESSRLQHLSDTYSCKLLFAKENRGYNAGNNIGIRYALELNAKYIFIANTDMRFPYTSYLKRLIGTLSSVKNAVAVGSDIITPEGNHQNPISFTFDSKNNVFGWAKKIIEKGNSTKHNWNSNFKIIRECSVLNGCCLLICSDFLRTINLFDERIFLFGEERIFGAQVIKYEKKMIYDGSIQALHCHKQHKEGKQWPRLRNLRQSELVFIKYHSTYSFLVKICAILSIELKYLLLHLKYYRR